MSSNDDIVSSRDIVHQARVVMKSFTSPSLPISFLEMKTATTREMLELL